MSGGERKRRWRFLFPERSRAAEAQRARLRRHSGNESYDRYERSEKGRERKRRYADSAKGYITRMTSRRAQALA